MRNFVITVNGKSYQVAVEEVGAVASAPVQPVSMPAPAAVPAAPQAAPAPAAQPAPAPAPAAAPAAPKATPANGEKVLSPFPGLIKELLVAEGAAVKKDQPVLVLEAMKMDNDITAPCDGTVSFCVDKGANVESDTVLCVIS